MFSDNVSGYLKIEFTENWLITFKKIKLGFTPFNAEQPLEGIELEKKGKKKMKGHKKAV